MSDPNPAAEAGAGAEALLGLAAGGSVHLPRLPSLPARGPEPPPLALPAPSPPSAPLYTTAPSLSLPTPPSAAHARFLPPPHDLPPRPTPSSFLPPPLAGEPRFPPLASIATWAAPERHHPFRGLPGTSYEPLNATPQSQHLNPLQAPVVSVVPPSQPLPPQPASAPTTLPDALPPPPPWEPTPHVPGALSHSGENTATEYAAADRGWATHAPALSFPYSAGHLQPSSPYCYFHGAHHAQQSHSVAPMQLPYQLPQPRGLSQSRALSHSPAQIPSLALPLPLLRRAVSSAPSTAGLDTLSTPPDAGMRPTLPALDAKFDAKENLLLNAARGEPAVSRVPDVLQDREALARDTGAGVPSTPRSMAKVVEQNQAEGSAERLRGGPRDASRPVRRGDLLALMNPTELSPTVKEEAETSTQCISISSTKLESAECQAEASTKIDDKPAPLGETDTKADPSANNSGASKSSLATSADDLKPGDTPRRMNGVASQNNKTVEELKRDEGENEAAPEEAESVESEITRCPCGSVANSGFMVACDQCNAWQHGRCMGFRRSSEVPESYFCNICRPEEMRVGCVAHPKFKERAALKDKEVKDSRRDYDPLLANVKPLELRKHFLIDLKQKRAGHKLLKGETFHRYATLMRNHFGKYRQSVLEGLVVILELSRAEVTEKLEHAVKRVRAGLGGPPSEDGSEQKLGTGLREHASSDVNNSRLQGNGQTNPLKRPRANSASVESSEAENLARGDSVPANDTGRDVDLAGADVANGRSMSREERKLLATMRLFAQMEERQREKKKPRVGEAGGSSPKDGNSSRPKTPRAGTEVRSVSPTHLPSRTVLECEEAKEGEKSMGNSDGNQAEDEAGREQLQRRLHLASISKNLEEQTLCNSNPNIVASQTSTDVEACRDQLKRDREQKGQDAAERFSLRRRETASPEAAGSRSIGRRKGILDRERSRERRRRRSGGVAKEAIGVEVTNENDSKRDACLDFKLWVPGPSVLGSRKIIRSRISSLERDLIELEEAAEAEKAKERTMRSDKKRWLLKMASKSGKKAIDWRAQSPAKKRYRSAGKYLNKTLEVAKQTDNVTTDNIIGQKNPSMLSVSMVVVSGKGNLPDKGQVLEASRLVLPSARPHSEQANGNGKVTKESGCLKKRPRMLPVIQENNDAPKHDLEKPPLTSEQRNGILPSKAPASTLPSSPQQSRSPASPARMRSPMLRSSPVPRVGVTGLRSVSPPAHGRGVQTLSTGSSPKLGSGSPPLISRSPSPDIRPSGANSVSARKTNGSASKHTSSDTKIENSLPKPTYEKARDPPLGTRLPGPPVSKPLSSAAVKPQGCGAAKSGATRIDQKRSTAVSSGVMLHPIRSVPVPSSRKREPLLRNGSHRTYIAGVSDGAAAVQLDSPRSKVGTSAGSSTISDFLQQRLQGFLKPQAAVPSSEHESCPGMHANVLLSAKNGRAVNAQEMKKPGVESVFSTSGGGASLPGPMPSIRNKSLEASSSWRNGLTLRGDKRLNGSVGVGRIPPSGIAGDPAGPRPSNFPGLEKTRFRSGTAGPSRTDVHVRNGIRAPAWNSYGHKNGWVGGNGRGHHSSDEANNKGGHRGQHRP